MPPWARLTWGEGDTPADEAPELAAEIGLERLVLKREDLSPTGSFKDRGLAFQASATRAAMPDARWWAISSSGNAAIAAARAASRAGLGLAAFVAPGTEPAKRVALAREGAVVLVAEGALTMAAATAAARGAPNLRPSVAPEAVPGFETLLWELDEAGIDAQGLVSFASSGTSLVGFGRARASARWRPELHVAQGAGGAPIAGVLDARPAPPGRRVGALGARKTRRLGEAVRLVRASGGAGWAIGDDEADRAAARLRAHGVPAALEAAAALAAAERAAREQGLRTAVVVISGAERPAPDPTALADADARCLRPRSVDEALAMVDGALGPARAANGAPRPPRSPARQRRAAG